MIEITHILKQTIHQINETSHKRIINITFESDFDEIFIMGNDLIYDVFENILINAIRYNKKPEIEINIILSKLDYDDISYVKIEFIDNGIGIEDNRKSFIFKRIEKSSIRGMGLGLSLVHKIINMYNGKIWVENKIENDYSQGSNFIIQIPEER